MRLLVDSHAILWAASDDPKLSDRARAAIGDPSNDVRWSIASAWELTIKASIGKLDLPDPVDEVAGDLGMTMLAVKPAHVRLTLGLPMHHRDPFDRMLVAQAMIEGLTLVTGDRKLRAYRVPTLW